VPDITNWVLPSVIEICRRNLPIEQSRNKEPWVIWPNGSLFFNDMETSIISAMILYLESSPRCQITLSAVEETHNHDGPMYSVGSLLIYALRTVYRSCRIILGLHNPA
jgi:hypothetical protein